MILKYSKTEHLKMLKEFYFYVKLFIIHTVTHSYIYGMDTCALNS